MAPYFLSAFAAIALCSATAAHATVNKYDFDWPLGTPETYLVSEVRDRQIVYFLLTGAQDAKIMVHWKDKNGDTLLRGNSFQALGLFDGLPDPGEELALTWGKSLGWLETTREADGVADFTGSQVKVNNSCTGKLHNCKPPAQYLERASILGESPAIAPRGHSFVAAASTPIDSAEGRLELRTYAGSPVDVPDEFTTKTLVVFASSVVQDGTDYIYTYTATNQTDQTLPFSWEQAGMAGVLDPNSSAERSFTAALSPMRRPSLATVTAFEDLAGGGLDILTPVPEAPAWAMLLAGLGLLGWHRRQVFRPPWRTIPRHGRYLPGRPAIA